MLENYHTSHQILVSHWIQLIFVTEISENFRKFVEETVTANGLEGWSSRETTDYPKYNHDNERYNETDPLYNQEAVDPKLVGFLSSSLVDFFSSKLGNFFSSMLVVFLSSKLVDSLSSKLVDFLSSSQRRNTDSLQHMRLKWSADDLCKSEKVQICKCAKGQKGQMCKCAFVQMCKKGKCANVQKGKKVNCANVQKGKKGKWPVEGRWVVPEPGRPSRVVRSHGLPELQGLMSTIKYQKSLQLI